MTRRDVCAKDVERARVLVVDDDRATRFLVRQSLERAGFDVDEAEDGSTAIDGFAARPPDIVLLDIVMPGLDGFATLSALRALPSGRDTPVVMITGLDDAASIHHAFEFGATSFVIKPLNYLLLAYTVRFIVRSHRVSQRLRHSEARLVHAQRQAGVGMWEWNSTDAEVRCSETFAGILGLSAEVRQVHPSEVLRLVVPRDRAPLRRALIRMLRDRRPCSLDCRIVSADGLERVIHQQVVALPNEGSGVRVFGTCQDVTERHRSERRIDYLASFDPVTGLANRTVLRDLLEHATHLARQSGRNIAVLFIDIDGFKRFSDGLEMDESDGLLAALAVRLCRALRCPTPARVPETTQALFDALGSGRDVIARYGGDEFVAVLGDIRCPEDAALAADRLHQAAAAPFHVGDGSLSLTVSIGISTFPADTGDPEQLLKNAETALYCAKDDGRGASRSFTALLSQQAAKRLALETGLRGAILHNELVLHYQPQLSLRTRKVVGVEALVRWRAPDGRLVPPGEFIPLAEETGLIVPIGEWVLRAACDQAMCWRAAGLRRLRLSVNLSAAQFRQPHLAERIAAIVAESGLDPTQLVVELTESQLLHDSADNLAILERLHANGVTIVIDDFGTGYSSLAYLKKTRCRALKIDRSFIRDVPADADDVAIVEATVALAHGLRMEVIAEGVETPAQLQLMIDLGCDEVQGFLLSRPLAADALASWLSRWSWSDIAQSHAAEAEFGTGECGPGECGPGEFGTGEFGTGEFGPGEFGPGEFGTGEFGTGEFGTGSFEKGSFEKGMFGQPHFGQPKLPAAARSGRY